MSRVGGFTERLSLSPAPGARCISGVSREGRPTYSGPVMGDWTDRWSLTAGPAAGPGPKIAHGAEQCGGVIWRPRFRSALALSSDSFSTSLLFLLQKICLMGRFQLFFSIQYLVYNKLLSMCVFAVFFFASRCLRKNYCRRGCTDPACASPAVPILPPMSPKLPQRGLSSQSSRTRSPQSHQRAVD